MGYIGLPKPPVVSYDLCREMKHLLLEEYLNQQFSQRSHVEQKIR